MAKGWSSETVVLVSVPLKWAQKMKLEIIQKSTVPFEIMHLYSLWWGRGKREACHVNWPFKGLSPFVLQIQSTPLRPILVLFPEPIFTIASKSTFSSTRALEICAACWKWTLSTGKKKKCFYYLNEHPCLPIGLKFPWSQEHPFACAACHID